jgi:large subunit ribosomal protein L19
MFLCSRSKNIKIELKEKEMDIIKKIQLENMKAEPPKFKTGDTVKVHLKVIEGKRERIQIFEGIVLKRQNGGVGETFTVRKLSSGIGVEKTFPIHSPKIEKVEVVREGKVRRAKLFYLRDRVGKAAKVKERTEKRR